MKVAKRLISFALADCVSLIALVLFGSLSLFMNAFQLDEQEQYPLFWIAVPLMATLGAMSGATLKRYRNAGISQLVPAFPSAMLSAKLMLLGSSGTVMIFAFEPLAEAAVAIPIATMIGLSAGLVLPATSAPLFVVFLVVVEILAPGSVIHHLVQPRNLAVATGIVAIALAIQYRSGGLFQPPARRLLFRTESPKHQPIQFGRFYPLREILQYFLGGVVAAALLGFQMNYDPESAQPLRQALSYGYGYILLFSLMGIYFLSIQRDGHARGWWRRLSILPGWDRDRIRKHLEYSLLRVALVAFAGVLAVLTTIRLAGIISSYELVALAVAWCLIVAQAAPLHLWIHSLQTRTAQWVGLIFLGAFLVVAMRYTVIRIQYKPISAPDLTVMVAAGLALAWILRRWIHRHWRTVSLERIPT